MKKHRHSRRHHSHRSLKEKKRTAIGTAAVALAVFGCGAGFLVYHDRMQNQYHVTSDKTADMGSGYRNITYNGKEYQYNSLITNILYAGVDSTGKMEASVQYGDQARADSIALVALDKKNQKMTVMAISRDTMTDIHRYTLDGKDRGAGESHLGFAYTYGDGGEASCENLVRAVSDLFGGIPIQEYVVTNQTSMPYLNDLVGDVTVTVPNDDLAQRYPKMVTGAIVTIDDENVTDYLHYRNTEQDFSNDGRIQRQESYITAYIPKAKQQLQQDLNGTWEKLQEMEDYLQTSITKNKYLDLASLMEQIDFSENDYYRLEGEDRAGEMHDEFYPDMQILQEKIIELFYEEV